MYPNLDRITHAVFRMGIGALYLQHGLQKLFGLLGGMGPTGAAAPLNSLMGLAGIMEFGGGLLMLVGFITRPVAAVLMTEMIAAFFIAHVPQGGWPVQNGGELSLLYALSFVFLAAHGAGMWSVDAWIARARRIERRNQTLGDRRHPIAA